VVHEESSVYDVSPRYRGCPFWEHAQIDAAWTVHLERARDQAQLQICHPLHSPQPGTGNRLVNDLRCALLRTTARPDFSRPRIVCNSIKTKRKREVGRVALWPDFCQKYFKKYIKTSFFRSCQKFKKIRKTFLQKYILFLKKWLGKFSCYLISKLARSTLTSPGPIGVKGRWPK
jgi:hypothetical protein